jgi:hypothetical protein
MLVQMWENKKTDPTASISEYTDNSSKYYQAVYSTEVQQQLIKCQLEVKVKISLL